MDMNVFVPIALFFAVVALAKIISDNRTRRRLIDRGVSAEEAQALLAPVGRTKGDSSLKWGLVTGAIGVALVIVHVASFRGNDPIVPGLILLFAGAALVAYSLLNGHAPRRRAQQ